MYVHGGHSIHHLLTCIVDEREVPTVVVAVKFSLRIRLFGGREWAAPRKKSSRPSPASTGSRSSVNAAADDDEEDGPSDDLPPSSTVPPISTDTARRSSARSSSSHRTGAKRSVLFREDTVGGTGTRRNYRKNIQQHLPRPSATHRSTRRAVSSGEQRLLGGGGHIGRNSADATEISLKGIAIHCRTYPSHNSHTTTQRKRAALVSVRMGSCVVWYGCCVYLLHSFYGVLVRGGLVGIAACAETGGEST